MRIDYDNFLNLFHLFVCLCVGLFCLHVCLCTRIILGTTGGQKKVLDLLELEIQRVGSCHVGAGN